MFSNKKGKKTAELDSLIGANTKMIGDVHFSGGLHIDGTVKGNVIAEGDDSLVTTSEKARIEGNVHVHSMVLSGEVIGDVYALKHIELAPNARVTGNVYYNLIEMAGGAEVNGSLIHYDNKDVKQDHASTEAKHPGLSSDYESTNDGIHADTEGKVQGGYN
jgi:cytoskeletal protein CcmA (bactofilin family)